MAFDLAEGGALCRSCRRGLPMSAEALALIRRILEGGLAGALAEPPGPVVSEVDRAGHLVARAPPRAAAAVGPPAQRVRTAERYLRTDLRSFRLRYQPCSRSCH